MLKFVNTCFNKKHICFTHLQIYYTLYFYTISIFRLYDFNFYFKLRIKKRFSYFNSYNCYNLIQLNRFECSYFQMRITYFTLYE